MDCPLRLLPLPLFLPRVLAALALTLGLGASVVRAWSLQTSYEIQNDVSRGKKILWRGLRKYREGGTGSCKKARNTFINLSTHCVNCILSLSVRFEGNIGTTATVRRAGVLTRGE